MREAVIYTLTLTFDSLTFWKRLRIAWRALRGRPVTIHGLRERPQ